MRVRWTEPAAHDLTQICDYIEEHDTSSTARRVAISIYRIRGNAVEILRILHGAQNWP
jgi:plasmid stabilization system protein ParE